VGDVKVVGLDHVQLAMPAGRESEAEAFYTGFLGFVRVPKPEPMARRGGCWFASGPVALHVGVEDDFRPARKAHPALLIRGLAELARTGAERGFPLRPNPDQPSGAGYYVDDPFGNRIELVDVALVEATGMPADRLTRG
jgi:catechol 2,3-dioxygenase-like lactoylglutathione lyase family enzyme